MIDERLLTQNSRPLWRRIGWLALGQGLEKSGQVLSVIALVRVLAPSEWNSVALCLSVYLVAVTAGSFNLEHSILFFLPQITSHERNALLAKTVSLLTLIGFVCASMIFLVQLSTGIFGNILAATLLGIAVWCELPTVIAGPVFVSQSQVRHASAWDSTQAIIQFTCILFPAVTNGGARGVLFGLALAGVIRLCSFVYLFSGVIKEVTLKLRDEMLKKQMVFCAPLGVALATGVLTRSIDKWMVAFREPLRIGAYAIAATDIPILAVLPYAGGAAIAVAMVQFFSAGEIKNAHNLWFQQAQTMSRSVVPMTLLLVLIAPELFTLLFSDAYASSVLPFQIFTMIGLHRVTEYGAVLRAAGRTKDIVYSSALLLVANLIFGFIGLHVGGIVGLTVGSVCAFAIAWWWMLTRLAQVFQSTLTEVFPWKTWLKSLIYSGIAFQCATVASVFAVGIGQQLLVKVLVMSLTILVVDQCAKRVVIVAGNLRFENEISYGKK